ncbi:MAG: HNH endonuclease [Acidimicrobiia bacterium]
MPSLVECCRQLRDELARLDPERLSGEACRARAEELAGTGKALAAARARTAARAAACGAHRSAGFSDPAGWLARSTGSRRGHAHPGEACHVVGGGPVPVSAVTEELEGDAFVKAVTHDGVRIDTVAHLGRAIPAHLRTALELGPPPSFDGAACAEAGCGRRFGLEWDHVDPVANGGPTSYANLQARCRPCHGAKTERDRAAGLVGGRRGARGPDPPWGRGSGRRAAGAAHRGARPAAAPRTRGRPPGRGVAPLALPASIGGAARQWSVEAGWRWPPPRRPDTARGATRPGRRRSVPGARRRPSPRPGRGSSTG